MKQVLNMKHMYTKQVYKKLKKISIALLNNSVKKLLSKNTKKLQISYLLSSQNVKKLLASAF